MVSVNLAVTVGMGKLAAIAALEKTLAAIVTKYALLIEAEAKALAPIDTGDLQDSIAALINGLEAEIRAGEGLPRPYAVYQEYGFVHWQTGKFIQNPYMRPALAKYRGAFISEVNAAIAAALS